MSITMSDTALEITALLSALERPRDEIAAEYVELLNTPARSLDDLADNAADDTEIAAALAQACESKVASDDPRVVALFTRLGRPRRMVLLRQPLERQAWSYEVLRHSKQR